MGAEVSAHAAEGAAVGCTGTAQCPSTTPQTGVSPADAGGGLPGCKRTLSDAEASEPLRPKLGGAYGGEATVGAGPSGANGGYVGPGSKVEAANYGDEPTGLAGWHEPVPEQLQRREHQHVYPSESGAVYPYESGDAHPCESGAAMASNGSEPVRSELEGQQPHPEMGAVDQPWDPMFSANHSAYQPASQTSELLRMPDDLLGTMGGKADLGRRVWLASEDSIITSSVKAIGFRWRTIAEFLPGRSDDAVRNRWHRLQESERDHEGSSCQDNGNAKTGYKCSKCGQPKRNHVCTFQPGAYDEEEAGAPQRARKAASTLPLRVSWTRHEDEFIRRNVKRLGPKWSLIAPQLQGRTEHAVRNRWHRLQNLDDEEARAAETRANAAGASAAVHGLDYDKGRGEPAAGVTDAAERQNACEAAGGSAADVRRLPMETPRESMARALEAMARDREELQLGPPMPVPQEMGGSNAHQINGGFGPQQMGGGMCSKDVSMAGGLPAAAGHAIGSSHGDRIGVGALGGSGIAPNFNPSRAVGAPEPENDLMPRAAQQQIPHAPLPGNDLMPLAAQQQMPHAQPPPLAYALPIGYATPQHVVNVPGPQQVMMAHGTPHVQSNVADARPY